MRKYNPLFVAASFVVFSLFASSNAEARQYKKVVNGREVVVHTNPVPVVLHRMVPPQHGRHVTQREVGGGGPSSGRVVSQRGR